LSVVKLAGERNVQPPWPVLCNMRTLHTVVYCTLCSLSASRPKSSVTRLTVLSEKLSS